MLPHTPIRFARGGMTLLEVMIAMAIMVSIFGAALSAIVQVSATTAAAKARLRAVAVLNLEMEEMRAMTFARLKSRLADEAFKAGTVTDIDYTGTAGRTYRWTRTEQTTAEGVSDEVKKIVVTVEWDTPRGTSSISSFSYFSQAGIHTSESAAT